MTRLESVPPNSVVEFYWEEDKPKVKHPTIRGSVVGPDPLSAITSNQHVIIYSSRLDNSFRKSEGKNRLGEIFVYGMDPANHQNHDLTKLNPKPLKEGEVVVFKRRHDVENFTLIDRKESDLKRDTTINLIGSEIHINDNRIISRAIVKGWNTDPAPYRKFGVYSAALEEEYKTGMLQNFEFPLFAINDADSQTKPLEANTKLNTNEHLVFFLGMDMDYEIIPS